MPRTPSTEVLAARYAAAVRRWNRAQAAAQRAQDAMQAAALAAVPPIDRDPISGYRYTQFVDDLCRNCGMGPDHNNLADLIPDLRRYWAKELSDA